MLDYCPLSIVFALCFLFYFSLLKIYFLFIAAALKTTISHFNKQVTTISQKGDATSIHDIFLENTNLV